MHSPYRMSLTPNANAATQKKFGDIVNVGRAAVLFKSKLKQGQKQNLKQASLGSLSSESSRLSIQVKGMGDTEDIALKLEDQLTNAKLIQLERIFEEADEDGGGGLDMDEFRNAMRHTMGEHIADHDMDILFMKVDTNCDGTVDWDEYLSYMLLEYRASDQMNCATQQKPLPKYLRQVPSYHHDSIVRIGLVQPSKMVHSSESTGRYITASKEGVINLWGMDMSHQKTYTIDQPKNTSLWVTDVVYLPNLQLLAVATTSDSLSFYDLLANKFSKSVTVTDLDVCALCLDYWYDPKDQNHAVFMWGDARGSVYALEFHDCQTYCFLHPIIAKSNRTRFPFCELLQGSIRGVTAYRLSQVHDDFVRQIMYVPYLGCFVSCAKNKETAMCVGDLEEKKTRSYFRVNNGIFSFDFCQKHNIIVTGGYDAVVRVWNPYVPKKAVMILQGHKSPVIKVAVNSEKEQIISLAEEKEIHIHDMTTQNIIQIIFRLSIPMGARPISAMFYNATKQALILANNQLAIFQHQEEEIQNQQLTSHAQPVNAALYNPLFNQVVSADSDSLVCVWNIETGDLLMQFHCHTVRHLGEDVNIEITAMEFDTTYRRLITGARDGTVKIWNFNNGACLRDMEVTDKLEVSGIICPKQRIITAGWNKKLCVYVDDRDDESLLVWPKRHHEDILSLSYYGPNLVASSSYDGDIMLWSIDSGHVISRLNAHESTMPFPGESTVSKQFSSNTSISAEKNDIDIGTWMENYMRTQELSEIDTDATSDSRGSTLITQEARRESTNQKKGNPSEPTPRQLKLKRLAKVRGELLADVQSISPTPPDFNNAIWCLGKHETVDEYRRKNESSVDKLLFLQTRENNKHTAILLASGAEGWVRAWSVHHEGGLLGQFNATHKPNESVLAMATDPKNEFLITGDTVGYIKVWDIVGYCSKKKLTQEEKTVRSLDLTDRFPFLRDDITRFSDVVAKDAQRRHAPPPSSSNPKKTHVAPLLVNSFRAHIGAIACLDYIPDREFILSCSDDCSVRLWSLYGQFIGIFGQGVPWRGPTMTSPVGGLSRKKPTLDRKLPPDVRRVASATTLKVLNNGLRPGWKLVRNVVMVWMPTVLKRKEAGTLDDTDSPDLQRFQSSVSTTQASPSPCQGSSVLGKYFKTTKRYRPPLPKPVIKEYQTQLAVYCALPTVELDIMEDFTLPPLVQEVQERLEQQQKFKMAHMQKRSRANRGSHRDFKLKGGGRKVNFSCSSRRGSASLASSKDSISSCSRSEKNLYRQNSVVSGNKKDRTARNAHEDNLKLSMISET